MSDIIEPKGAFPRVAAILLAVGLVLIGTMMAKSEEFICSPMTGQLVTADGGPAGGVSITREWFAGGKSGRDTAKTDAEGRFAFAAVHPKRSLLSWLPGEKAVRQVFSADLDTGRFEFLDVHSRGYGRNAETGGKDFNMRCRIGVTPGKGDVGWGTCTLIE